MATRIERVVLELDDNLTSGMVKAAAATALLKRELGGLDGQNVKSARSTKAVEDEVRNLGNTAGGSSRQIDRFSGRLRLLADAAITLGPALIPIGAEAVPAVTALASGFGFAAAGAGTAALAFHGVGDALTKFNKAALAPTAANITAAQTAMDKLPRSAQAFVLELHQLSPALKQLQQAAGSGLFPGLTSGLHALQRDAPLAKRGLHSIGLELGNLGNQAAHSLSSDKWRPFLRFVSQEGPVALDDLGHSAGSLVHGLAELWMAFNPINNGVDAGLRRLAADFDKWASSLSRSNGFKSFVTYLQENGPRVIDTLGELGKTLVDIAVAAAPIGGVTLGILNAVFKVVDAIARSDFGTPLLAGIIAVRLYARAMQLAGQEVSLSFRTVALAPKQMEASLTSLIAKTGAYAAATRADLEIVTTSWLTAGAMSEREAARFSAATGRLKSQAATVAKAGAAVAGVAFVASGAADSLGFANTASLGLLGTLAGPYGAAVGVAIGATLDFKKAAQQAGQAQKTWDAVLNNSRSSFGDYTAALAGLVAEQKKWQDIENSGFFGALGTTIAHPLDVINHDLDGLTGKLTERNAATHAALVDSVNLQAQVALIGSKLGAPDLQPSTAGGAVMIPNLERLTAIADRLGPAMTALGLSFKDLVGPNAERAAAAIARWTKQADTSVGRTKAVAAAFAQMGDQSLSTTDRVQALSDALNQLLGPGLNVSAAKDAFQQGLNDLRQGLAKTTRSLKGNSDAVIQNRQAIRDQVSNISDYVQAQAAAGASPEKLTKSLKDQRQALIDAGVEAGISRKEMRDYLNQLGLTPKLIRTTITATGIDRTERQLQHLTRDRVIHLVVRTDGVDTASTGGRVLTGQADGGTVRGSRAPYGDKVLTMLAPGEEVISNRHGQADQHRDLLKAINSRRYAEGGTVAAARVNVHVASARAASSPSIDYGRMASAMSAMRPAAPLYGDVHISGDPSAFKREMARDRAMAALSGVRRG